MDGLRGLAVLWVLGYHAALDGFDGGYLGVSAFFTLSGFLLTSLALGERSATGGFSLRRFWARRFRRLMPAALVTLGGIVVMGAWVWSDDQLANLRGDVLSALAYVANWRLIFDHSGYAQAFQEPSPIQHFWSLAIEEQFYVLFPLAVVTVFAIARVPRRALGVTFVTVAVASTVTMALLYEPGSTSRAYLGTGSRLAELAVGCLLAVVVNADPDIAGRRAGLTVRWLGAIALGACLIAWTSTAIDSSWLYHGGFAFHAVAIAAVLLAAVQAGGPVRRVLALRPLVWLGVVSYGVYLFHWPIFLWLDEDRTGLDDWPLFALRLAVTLPLAALSMRLLERPIRRRRWLTGWRPALVVPATVIALIIGLVAVTNPDRLGGATALPDTNPNEPPPTIIEPDPPPPTVPGAPPAPVVVPDTRVMLMGDSVAVSVAMGLQQQQSDHDLSFWGRAALGCGVVRSDQRLVRGTVDEPPGCNQWPTVWAAEVDQFDPHVAVYLGGRWDALDHKVNGEWLRFGTPEWDAYVLSELDFAVETLGGDGAHVVLLTCPYFERELPDGTVESDLVPARVDHWNALLRRVAAQRPSDVTVIDINQRLAPDGEYTNVIDNVEVRGDGIHLTLDGTKWLAEWLGPKLRDVGLAHDDAGSSRFREASP